MRLHHLRRSLAAGFFVIMCFASSFFYLRYKGHKDLQLQVRPDGVLRR